jgi:hypothetical protein
MKNVINSRWIYNLIALILILLVIIIPFFRIDGGLVDDDFYYINIAESLPNYQLSVFPLGYPLLLRMINFIFNDYFITSRVIAIFSFIFILLFSKIKDFFFKETVLLMGFKFFTIFFYSLSETVFLPIFYITIYSLYNILVNKKNMLFLLGVSVFILVTIRYSGLFVWSGIFLYSILNYFLYNAKEDRKWSISLFKSLFLSLSLIILFLLSNLYFTHAFFGENVRENSLLQSSTGLQFLLRNILFPFYIALNPISEIFRFSFFSFIFTLIIASVFSSLFLYLLYRNFKTVNKNFLVLSIVMMLVYFSGLIYSSYKTGIEAMHFRLNTPIVFLLFFIIIISIKNKIGSVILLFSAFFSISINLYYNLNNSFNYLEKRNNVISYYNKNKKDYYHNDIAITPTETGGVLTSNFFTIYCINPKVRNLNSIPKNIEKDKIVFEKELTKIKPQNRNYYLNNFSITK